MKVYTVARAPVDVFGCKTLLEDGGEVHLTLSLAESAARQLARSMPGVKICIIEGEPIKTFSCEPMAVLEESVDFLKEQDGNGA